MVSSVSPLTISVFCIFGLYFVFAYFSEGWTTSVYGYARGNRRRVIAVLKMQCVLTLINIFQYYQFMHYFNFTEKDVCKFERRQIALRRHRCTVFLIVFSALGQLMYAMYYAPDWVQWLFFDLTTISAGIWTNLIAFTFGFAICNALLYPCLKIPCIRLLLDMLSKVQYLKELIYSRKHQIRFSIWATLVMSFLMWYSSDKVVIKHRTIPIRFSRSMNLYHETVNGINYVEDRYSTYLNERKCSPSMVGKLSRVLGMPLLVLVERRFFVQNYSGSDDIRFAVVSDIHAGASVYRHDVDSVVDKVLGLDVDAVLVIGDMVDGEKSQLENRVQPIWHLPKRFPTYFVTGNHDYYYGDVQEWIRLYEKHDIHVLENNHTLFKGICLAGVNDLSSGKMGIYDHYMNASTAISDCPKGATRILMSHNPASVKDISTADLSSIDLVLSGHTHAGQFYVVFPIVYWMLPYFYGMYDLPAGSGHLMVSAGTLFQGPNMKMLGMSEIWVVTLTSAKTS